MLLGARVLAHARNPPRPVEFMRGASLSPPEIACARTRSVSQTVLALSYHSWTVWLEHSTCTSAAALRPLVHPHAYARACCREKRSLICFLVLSYAYAALSVQPVLHGRRTARPVPHVHDSGRSHRGRHLLRLYNLSHLRHVRELPIVGFTVYLDILAALPSSASWT
jgi:hypothetical protein